VALVTGILETASVLPLRLARVGPCIGLFSSWVLRRIGTRTKAASKFWLGLAWNPVAARFYMMCRIGTLNGHTLSSGS
jgi:hypothetical protein